VGEWEARRYDASQRETWDELARSARQRSFLFERAYMEYHADRFEDASLLLLRKGRAVALLPASRDGDRVVSHGGLTFGGLLSTPELTAVQAVEALETAAAHHAGAGARTLVVKPVPHIYHAVPAEEELYALARLGATLTRRDVSAALCPGAAPPYSQERRRAVKRAARASLTLDRSDRFADFVTLLEEILRDRHGAAPVHSAAELELLAGRFPEQIRLYAATRPDDDALLAGVVVYETETVAHCQYIGASDAGRETRAQDALFDHLIAEVYAGKRWFDFGTSMRPADGSLDEGLMRNKEGFGGRAVLYDRYELALSAP
jgi:hypothetical protein